MRFISLLTLTLLVAGPAVAAGPQDGGDNGEGPKAVSMIEDQELKAFRFIIDGREVARLNSNGLIVVNGITYGGVITDAGSAWVEEKLDGATPAKESGDAQ